MSLIILKFQNDFNLAEMGRNKKKLKRLKSDLASIGKHKQDGEILALKQKINQQLAEIGEVETRLPGNNGFYLRLIVGDLNLTLPTSELKRKYKESYEKWKMCKCLNFKKFSTRITSSELETYFF